MGGGGGLEAEVGLGETRVEGVGGRTLMGILAVGVRWRMRMLGVSWWMWVMVVLWRVWWGESTWMALGGGIREGYLIAGFLAGSLEMGFFAHLEGFGVVGREGERCFVVDCKGPWEMGVLLKKGGPARRGGAMGWLFLGTHAATLKNKIKQIEEVGRLGGPQELSPTKRTNTVVAARMELGDHHHRSAGVQQMGACGSQAHKV